MTLDEIRRLKTEHGYSNRQMAELSGLPLSTVQKVLGGTTAAPRRSTLLALASVFPESRNAGAPCRSFTYDETDRTGDPPGCVGEAAAGYAVQPQPFFGIPKQSLGKFPRQGSYTLEDYLALPEDQRVELIDGVFFEMYSPTMPHQMISMAVSLILGGFIAEKGGSCVPFAAPADVQLDCDDRTIVQPDVFVVCDRSKITRARIFGAPDLVIEILSPSTRLKDILIKSAKYIKAGVREYWLVDPGNETVTKQLMLPPDAENPEGNLKTWVYSFEDSVPVSIFEDECVIDFKEIYEKYSFIEK